MKHKRKIERLARRQATHVQTSRDEGPRKRWASGGYPMPGSVNKAFGRRRKTR